MYVDVVTSLKGSFQQAQGRYELKDIPNIEKEVQEQS